MEKLAIAKMLAKLDGIELQIKDLVDDWILITYDLPVPEGNETRRKFLKLAPKIGAMMHTRSVYFMPLTEECQKAAYELSKIGEVFIWTSNSFDDKTKTALTKIYDTRVNDQINIIEKRINRINQHLLNGKTGMANRMLEKTASLFNSLVFVLVQRQSKSLYDKLNRIQNQLLELENE